VARAKERTVVGEITVLDVKLLKVKISALKQYMNDTKNPNSFFVYQELNIVDKMLKKMFPYDDYEPTTDSAN
jgi:hypothetical protein